jgi:uncharacterized protein YcbX
MRIRQAGFTPIKGGRHLDHPFVDLAAEGPVGDRMFCLVDLARGRVLRTVENPSLLACTAHWLDGVLSIDVGGVTLEAAPRPSGHTLELDFWGRPAAVEIVDGPWASAYSRFLGFDVVLARAVRPGELIYGASVTIVTTSGLRMLAEKTGLEIDSHRFRATFVIDTEETSTDELDAQVEDSWAGRELQLGSARIRVLAGIDRCAVIDADTASGAFGTRLLRSLADYRLRDGAIDFGMYAEVSAPGRVFRDDPVTVIPAVTPA